MPNRIRSYHITTGGDIKVTDFTRPQGEQDISAEYQNIAEDRKNRRINAWLDVEEDDAGGVHINLVKTDGGIRAARDAALLYELFCEDLKLANPSPRSFTG